MRESYQFTYDEVQRLLMQAAHDKSKRVGAWSYTGAGMSIVGNQDDAGSIVFTVSWADAHPTPQNVGLGVWSESTPPAPSTPAPHRGE